jgi:hypothetical protein
MGFLFHKNIVILTKGKSGDLWRGRLKIENTSGGKCRLN